MFDFVNSYYEQVSPIIRTFKVFIVKYMGDGVMAVSPNRADDALQAAITKQQCVAEYNEHRLKKGDPTPSVLRLERQATSRRRRVP